MNCINSTKKFFNEHADEWEHRIKADDKNRLSKIFKNDIPDTAGPVLDLGCGTGILVPFIKSNGTDHIVEVDIASKMLSNAKSKYNCSVDYCAADSHHLPFNSNYFSSIFCFNTFPHFNNKLVVIKEITRCLKKDGQLFIIHLMCHRKLNSMHSNIKGSVKHDRMLPKDKMIKALKDAGLNIITAEENPEKYLIIAKK